MLDIGNAMRFCVLVQPALHGISIRKSNRGYAVYIVGMCTIIKPQEWNQSAAQNVVLFINRVSILYSFIINAE